MIRDSEQGHEEVARRLKDVASIEHALALAGREALAAHYRAGRDIPMWREGRVVWEDAAKHLSSEKPPSTNNR